MAVILHVDMDAFFASCELVRHPEWRGKALIVGSGPDERGVVSTCSYEARKFGVHSAMPSRSAARLCPQAIFTPPDMGYYSKISKKAFEVFESFTPYVEPVSVDEAFLDISGSLHLYGNSPKVLGEALRKRIHEECQCTCSVGIAPNRLLAKIGSEWNKPDGLAIMPFSPAKAKALLAPKPIGILWGVGKKTQTILARHGIRLCSDIQNTSVDSLAAILSSRVAAETISRYARGESSSAVNPDSRDEKSVSREYTFDTDESSRRKVREKLLGLVVEVAMRFRRRNLWARTARLKFRTKDFSTMTRQMPFASPSRDDKAFRLAAMELFDSLWPESAGDTVSVRLIGFGVANFQSFAGDGELELSPVAGVEDRARQERLSCALDKLRKKGLISANCDFNRKETPKT